MVTLVFAGWALILDRGEWKNRDDFVSLEKLNKLVEDLIMDLFWTRVRLPAPPPFLRPAHLELVFFLIILKLCLMLREVYNLVCCDI